MNRDNSVERCDDYKKQETQREVVEGIEIQSARNKKTHREQSHGQDRVATGHSLRQKRDCPNSRRTQFKLPLLKRE